MARVVVLGGVLAELSVRVGRMPAAGERIEGEGTHAEPGGHGGNVAVAAAKMGVDAALVSAVGDDALGQMALEGLARAGVDCSRVRSLPRLATGVAMAWECADGGHAVTDPGATRTLGASDARLAGTAGERGVWFVTRADCPEEALVAGLRAAREAGMRSLMAPAGPVCAGALSLADVVSLDAAACEALAGAVPTDEASCREAAARVRGRGASGDATLVFALGLAGSFCLDAAGRLAHVPAIETGVVDVRAAGDAYVGALAAGLACGLEVSQAMTLGNAMEGITLGRPGGQRSIPDANVVGMVMRNSTRNSCGVFRSC